jgi:alpha-D-ribose 1-methylphosphonate 5-triphosphate synthase subunit PhnI
MDQRIANEIAGNVAPRDCQPSDHPITAEERAFALEIAAELYTDHTLAEDLAGQEQSEREYCRANGLVYGQYS